MAPLLLLVVTGLLVVGLVAFLGLRVAPADRAANGFIERYGLGPDIDVRRAVLRFLGRTRDYARRGMVLGVLSAIVLGIAWYQTLLLGFGVSPLADLLTMGLGGWFVGLLLSARYWHRPSTSGVRTAPLTPRDPDRYRSAALARGMVAVAVACAVVGLGALLPGTAVDRAAIVGLGLVVVVTVVSAWRTQARIARRPQPFVTGELLAADEAIRSTSVVVIGLAAMGLGLVMFGWQVSFVVRGSVGDVTWWGFLPVPALVAGLLVAARARRRIHPWGPAVRDAVPA